MKILIEESTLRQALEALEFYNRRCEEQGFYSPNRQPLPKNAITALRTALEAAEKVKPVAWIDEDLNLRMGKPRLEGPLYAHPAPAVPEGWLKAIDDAMVVCHLGVAEATDSYETAKQKLHELIQWHIQVATDPCVNGGWQLVPCEPTEEMYFAFTDKYGTDFDQAYEAMLAAVPTPEET